MQLECETSRGGTIEGAHLEVELGLAYRDVDAAGTRVGGIGVHEVGLSATGPIGIYLHIKAISAAPFVAIIP